MVPSWKRSNTCMVIVGVNDDRTEHCNVSECGVACSSAHLSARAR